jgi:hypothetical protein
MMTLPLEQDMIAAPVAAIDRRVLPQAWYHALRLERDLTGDAKARFPVVIHDDKGGYNHYRNAGRFSRAQSVVERAAQFHDKRREFLVRDVEWRPARSFKTSSARHCVSPVTVRQPKVERSVAAVHFDGNRIGLLLQSADRYTATLLIRCATELRGSVYKAVAEARVRLAAHGIVLTLSELGET